MPLPPEGVTLAPPLALPQVVLVTDDVAVTAADVFTFTVVVEEQPPPVTVTVYVPPGTPLIDWPVPPLLHA